MDLNEQIPEIDQTRKSLRNICGITDLYIEEQEVENPNYKEQQPVFTINFPGIGQIPFTAGEGPYKRIFTVTIVFKTELNIQEFEREIAQIVQAKPYFKDIKRNKDNPLALDMEMTRECAERLYDIDTYGEIDAGLIDKYGGPETMEDFLFRTLLRERVIEIKKEGHVRE